MKMNLEKINSIGGRNTSIAQLQSVGRDDVPCSHVGRAAAGKIDIFLLVSDCHLPCCTFLDSSVVS